MEFDLIHRHFKIPFAALVDSGSESVLAGIGDDCAALRPAENHGLYISTDTLVEDVHFFKDDSPNSVGWKALASNLSDLAACGASPIGFTLNLSLPKVDESWLAGFSAGMLELATQFRCPLVGGDTTSAGANKAITLSITVFGQAPLSHLGFHRAAAQAGDEVWVSGVPGLARLGLMLEYQSRGQLGRCCTTEQIKPVLDLLSVLPHALKSGALNALRKPIPRLALSQQLHHKANACVDLSDGLSGDLAHIAVASGLSAVLDGNKLKNIWLDNWPELASALSTDHLDTLLGTTLQGGDDFELCWTAPAIHHDAIQSLESPTHCIGQIQAGEGVWLSAQDQAHQRVSGRSYNHFAEYNP